MPPPFHNPFLFQVELIFTLIVFTLCIIIYQKTKESYRLTQHQGIALFRKAFLFFGLSYLIRFLLMLPKMVMGPFFQRGGFSPLVVLFLSYLSTMAIFYLVLSILWKKFHVKPLIISGHFIAILLSLVSFLTRTHFILIYIQSIFLITAIILIFLNQHQKKTLIRTIYILIFIFWLINLWVINPGKIFLPMELKIIFHLISVGLFILIYYKISKWLK